MDQESLNTDETGERSTRERIENALALMLPRDRNLLVYRYHHQLSSLEIAGLLRMPIEKVDTALARAEARLSKRVQI